MARKNILYVGERSGFYERELIRGILSVKALGLNWKICGIYRCLGVKELKSYLDRHEVDGVIGRGLSQETMKMVEERGLPAVMLRSFEREESRLLNGPHADDEVIGELAGEHFFYLELKHWGFVHFVGMLWSEARRESFCAYARSHGVVHETVGIDSVGIEHSEETAKVLMEWLKALPKPCGVLACNDEVGVLVLNACQDLGLVVPDEVAVVGVDNDRLLCEMAMTSLSSIDLRATEVGRAAGVQLGKMLGEIGEEVEVESSRAICVVRESSRRSDRARLIYQKAMDAIEVRPIAKSSVVALARSCGVSRRSLERAFAECGEQSPGEVMREKRVAVILDLLRDQGVSLEGVSQQAGFGDVASFSNFVKRMTGRTPGSFRLKGGE